MFRKLSPASQDFARIEITPAMVDRAAKALMAQESQARLTDIYGRVDPDRARRFARAALEDALDVRFDD